MTYEDYLQHWGILGMKWGQRNGPPYPLNLISMNAAERRAYKKERYENKTAEVKEKIDYQKAKLDYKNAKQELKVVAKEANSKPKAPKPEKVVDSRDLVNKNPRKLNDADLDKAIARRSSEKRLRELNNESISNGKKFVTGALAVAGTTAISRMLNKAAQLWGESRGQRLFDNVLNKKETREKKQKETEEKAKKEREEAEERAKKSSYDQAFDNARRNASRMVDRDLENSSPEKRNIDYNERIRRIQELTNHFMINQGYDKPYKKDK